MTGYKIVNLKTLLEAIGEERTKQLLSIFACPKNPDVEGFLKNKAIEFSAQGLSQTHLVLASYKDRPEIIGYFTLANKYIVIKAAKVSSTLRKKLSRFALRDHELKAYPISAPLIAQIGKTFGMA